MGLTLSKSVRICALRWEAQVAWRTCSKEIIVIVVPVALELHPILAVFGYKEACVTECYTRKRGKEKVVTSSSHKIALKCIREQSLHAAYLGWSHSSFLGFSSFLGVCRDNCRSTNWSMRMVGSYFWSADVWTRRLRPFLSLWLSFALSQTVDRFWEELHQDIQTRSSQFVTLDLGQSSRSRFENFEISVIAICGIIHFSYSKVLLAIVRIFDTVDLYSCHLI